MGILILGIIASVILIYRGGSSLQEIIYLSKFGIETEAEIISNEQKYLNNTYDNGYYDLIKRKFIDYSSINFYPILEFKDKANNHFIIRDKKNLSPKKHKLGKKIKITYDESNPRINYINLESEKIISTALTIFGIVLFIIFSYLILSKI